MEEKGIAIFELFLIISSTVAFSYLVGQTLTSVYPNNEERYL
jgi:hypothetical protein